MSGKLIAITRIQSSVAKKKGDQWITRWLLILKEYPQLNIWNITDISSPTKMLSIPSSYYNAFRSSLIKIETLEISTIGVSE